MGYVTKQRTRRGKDPLAGHRQRPLGTPAQARRNQETRDYKNRIHELETALHGAQVVIENLGHTKIELDRQVSAAAPSHRVLNALDALSGLTVAQALRAGILDSVVALVRWRDEMAPRKVASGKESSWKMGTAEKVASLMRAVAPKREG